MTRDEFVRYVLDGGKGVASKKEAKAAKAVTDALPDGFETKFGAPVGPPVVEAVAGPEKLFAEKLLRGCGFGEAETLDRARVILGDNPAARYLSEKVLYWQKDADRPYQTLLFETDQKWTAIARAPLFKTKHSAHLDLLEDALTQLVQSALEGFQRGGEGRTADVKRGQQNETLCVISLVDDRDPGDATRLVCLGTVNAVTGSLEVFFLRESCRSWEKQLREEYLGALYERQFKKLTTSKWQEAFTTEEERKLARDLVKECEGGSITEKKLANRVIGLLDEIAKGFGLRKKAGEDHRLTLTKLPEDHDIGADPDDAGSVNPFAGMSVRDEKRRLLGYIVYCLTKKADVDALRARLKEHNRFHNVLVVYPDNAQASFELWQGRDSLEGRLTKKGAKFSGEAQVISLLSRFFVVSRAKVKNPAELADELASRAKYLRRLAEKQLDKEKTNGHLRDLFEAFKEALIHDMTEQSFADAFAQTLTYGLLTARWLSREEMAATGERFTRESALKHLPSTSPFLTEFFEQALDASFAPNLVWLMEDIAELLDRVNIDEVFGNAKASKDPVIDFYEPFLAAYDPAERHMRGVYYTPQPIVSYIVAGVDELLRTEIGLSDGLASLESWREVLASHPGLEMPVEAKLDDTFVRILDPATGTGTFLVACIELIEKRIKKSARERLGVGDDHPTVTAEWQAYVTEHLLPRLYGFEIMIAPYAIAHLKVGLKLLESGVKLKPADQLNIFLTNSLAPATDFAEHFAFDAPALARQARAVNTVKTSVPFTVVIGNPPYSNFGRLNDNPFIAGLIEDYKSGLAEKKINLDDDYIKFFRLAHSSIVDSHVGVMGLITNHAYLDGITHRRMRETLVSDFATIRFVDLHGNARRAEVAPAGGTDENVFDIMQGVAIGLFATHSSDTRSVSIAHLHGRRVEKYEAMASEAEAEGGMTFTEVSPLAPYFLFCAVSGEDDAGYQFGTPLSDVFVLYQSPIQTKRDGLTIHFHEAELAKVLADLSTKTLSAIHAKYDIAADGRDWALKWAIDDVKSGAGSVIRVSYKPFDTRYTYFSGKTKGFIAYPRTAVMRHMLRKASRALVFKRQGKLDACGYTYFFVVNTPFSEGLFAIDNRGREFIAPVLLVADATEGGLALDTPGALQHNFSAKFLAKVAKALSLPQTGDHLPKGVQALDIFHYIYAVVSSPSFRERFASALRVDFPRIPLTQNRTCFDSLSAVGQKLCDLHVLETVPPQSSCVWTGSDGPVEKVSYDKGTIWIDVKQSRGWSGVSQAAWDYWIGGYQVCKKWLTQRKGRALSFDDKAHFMRVVSVLEESGRLTQQIDAVITQHGGWTSVFAAPVASRAGE